jgi:heat shock protein HslJ
VLKGDSATPLTPSRDEAAPSIMGRLWQWVGTTTPVEQIQVRQPERYTLLLNADGTAQVRFDCNRGGGNYEITDNQLAFGPLVATRKGCAPDTQDTLFSRQLDDISSYFVRDDELFLEMPYDGGTMRFQAAAQE